MTISHPAMTQTFRLVANQFAPVTLGGQVHQPAPMQIKPPDQGGDANPRMTLRFPRASVWREFKRELGRVQGYGTIHPIGVRYAVFLGDTEYPEIDWPLYASDQSGIQFTSEAIQITAADTNPMRRGASEIYTPDVFTGLDVA